MTRLDQRRRRSLHRARYRGFREADILIGGFAEAFIPSMSEHELDAFDQLLSCSDHELYSAIVEGAPEPDGADSSLIARMRLFNLQARSEEA